MVAAACGGGSVQDTNQPPAASSTDAVPSTTAATPTTSDTSTTSASPEDEASTTTTVVLEPPSQSKADARRDGVVAEVAELPLRLRVEIISEVAADEGVWAITHLADEADQLADGCRLGPGTGKYPTDFICTYEYGEVLLLDTERKSILRAYPLPGVPPEFITVTDDAVYCGRTGALPLNDSMVCRIDRSALTETVKVYQPGLDSVIVQPCFFPPASWSVAEELLEMTDLVATTNGVFAQALDGTWTHLDPIDLSLVTRSLLSAEVAG
jgi:hypothetical protein